MPPPRLKPIGRSLCQWLSTHEIQTPIYAPPTSWRRLHSSTHSLQQANQRYGTANEPPAHLGSSPKRPSPSPDPPAADSETSPDTVGPAKLEAPATPETSGQELVQELVPENDGDGPLEPKTLTGQFSPPLGEAPSANDAAPKTPPSATDASAALSSILSMKPPMAEDAGESHPPHLQAPQYVHHFDTYSFVKALQTESAFSELQSIVIMKAIRSALSSNMDLAREGIVSRGDAEMDAYQFKAASGELRTELRQRRAAADERYRADRTQLQHELDSLAGRITSESLNLKDELKGMFDDRKMAVRMERRNTDNRIQELNYTITSAMNSGMRNEIEGLRFILTRRTVLALTVVVLMSLGALRLATYSNKQEEKKEREKGRQQIGGSPDHGGGGGAGQKGPDDGDSYESAQLPGELTSEEISRRVQRGDNPALASLG